MTLLWFPIVRAESRAHLADIEPRRFDLFIGQGTHQPPQDAALPELSQRTAITATEETIATSE